jgi:hypothetical protein
LEIIISHNEEQNYVLLRKMGGTRDHYVNWNKSHKDKYPLKQQRPTGEGDQELEKRSVWEKSI